MIFLKYSFFRGYQVNTYEICRQNRRASRQILPQGKISTSAKASSDGITTILDFI